MTPARGKIEDEFDEKFVIKYKKGHCDKCGEDDIGQYLSTATDEKELKSWFFSKLDSILEEKRKKVDDLRNNWDLASKYGCGFNDALTEVLKILE